MASVFKLAGNPTWIVEFTDYQGRRRRRTSGTTDKRTAERVGAKYEADEALRKSGIVDPRLEAFAKEDQRPFKDHVTDYVEHLKLAGRVPHHCADVKRQLLMLSEVARVDRLSGITAATVERVLEHRGEKLNNGARTLNKARGAFLAFVRWAVKVGRMRENPLATVPRMDELNDRKRRRRALTDKEIASLFHVAEQRGRLAFYATALYSGLRRSELGRLTWGDVDLDAGTITVREGKAKHRIDAVPVHPDLAGHLRGIRPEIPHPSARVFTEVPDFDARRADFEAAGIAEVDSEGRRADLHALRATLATLLARQGVQVQVAQRIMRHSTVDLTLRSYTKLRIDDLAGGMSRIAAVVPKAAEASESAAAATGTHGGGGVSENLRTQATGSRPAVASRCDDSTSDSHFDDGCNASTDDDLCEPLQLVACGAEGGDRTLTSLRTVDFESGSAPGNAAPSQRNPTYLDVSDPVLARLVAAWPTLGEPIKAAVLALVSTATGTKA